MLKSKSAWLAVSVLALGVTACNDAETTDPVVVDTPATDTVATTDDFDPASRDYTLSEEATTRRAAFDNDAFNTEYDGYRDEDMAEMSGDGDTANTDMASGSNAASNTDSSANTNANANMSGSSKPMMARSQMTYSYLDRNSDGKLSVAEYGIWALPYDPTKPKPNDQTKPYTTADQANKAADSFFYYDADGDSYLSESEFTTARTGADVG